MYAVPSAQLACKYRTVFLVLIKTLPRQEDEYLMLGDVSILPLQRSFLLDRDWNKSFHVYDPLCYNPELKNSAGDVNNDVSGWHISYLYTGGFVSNWRSLLGLSVVIKWQDGRLTSYSSGEIRAKALQTKDSGGSVFDLLESGLLKVGMAVMERSAGQTQTLHGVVKHCTETLSLSSVAIRAIRAGSQPTSHSTLEALLLGNLSNWLEPPMASHSFSAGLGWSLQAERILTQALQARPLFFEETEFVYRNAWEDRLSESYATVGALRKTPFIDWELPKHSLALSEWPSMRALLEEIPITSHLQWLDEHHAQFHAAQAIDPKYGDPCQTYLQGVESGTEISLDSLLLKYTECHAAMLRGESEPRLLVFRWDPDSDLGFGNMVTFMATALLNAIVFRRAFLVDHESFRHDLRGIVEPPAFDWDLRSATTKLRGWKSLKTVFVSRSCKELVEDTVPVLVIDVSPCITVTSLITDEIFKPFLPLFPTRQPALIIGALSHALFQPGPDILTIAGASARV